MGNYHQTDLQNQIWFGSFPLLKYGQSPSNERGGKLLSSCNLFFLKWKVCYQHLERKVNKSWSLDVKINFINFSQQPHIHTANLITLYFDQITCFGFDLVFKDRLLSYKWYFIYLKHVEFFMRYWVQVTCCEMSQTWQIYLCKNIWRLG